MRARAGRRDSLFGGSERAGATVTSQNCVGSPATQPLAPQVIDLERDA
jgi:hypothetical protein